MQVLFEAIYNRFVSEGKFGLTELYNTEAPADAVFPYGVFSIPSNTPDWTFTENFENFLIQFNLFSEKTLATEACEAFEALKTAFDFHDLVVVGYTPITMEREVANVIRVEKVWQYNITYRLLIQKG